MGKNAAGKKASDISAGPPVITTWELCDPEELGTARSDSLLVSCSPGSVPGWLLRVVFLQLSLGIGLSQGRGGQTRRQHGLKELESETVGELSLCHFPTHQTKDPSLRGWLRRVK